MIFLKEYFKFLKKRKKLWLVPILTLFILLATVIVLAGNPAVTPFIYALF
ncbi:conserved hypothetical protein [Halobacteriovorax marinus SJ]|uniref:Uncharacterized protein n=1 Tax=Halobacteriovorax marinus (strain ATCC BAA-682 / DSM 15412 / SJ) TaxID=862908 RepID=E1X0X7_HALMS|nr:conserved hypothetical protein [Halobacteriovorax marinus SJ]